MSGHAFINHKNQKKREKNGLQKCGQSITDWKKGRKKIPPFYGIWEKSGRRAPVSGISASADAPGKLDKSERMVGVCVHGNAENAKTAGRKNSRSVFPGVRCVRREAAAASKRISVVLPHDSASQNSCRKTAAAAVRRRGSGCGNLLQRKACRSHLGGYLSFSVDLTPYLKTGENELAVKVRDETDTDWKGRGKQSLTPGGMFYTAQSGIWQSVWMEWVPETYLERIVITPEYDTASVKVRVFLNGPDAGLTKKITVRESEAPDAKVICVRETRENEAELILGNFAGWSPEHPHLYGVSIEAGEDRIESYFGMRKFGIGKDEKGITRLLLNGKPYFQNGVLDQGYWPESFYTPPSDEAMVYDIKTAKRLGFNMIRKHLKVECARWYSHCDHIGMLVWQDMINGGGRSIQTFLLYLPTVLPFVTTEFRDNCYPLFSRTSKTGREWWKRECRETVHQLYNAPCVSLWVLFNEGWGQFDAREMTEMVRALDPTRQIDHASGWYDQGAGDIKSLHNYFRPLKVKPEERAFAFSEYGGYTYPVQEHLYSEKSFGYRTYQNQTQYQKAMNALAEKIRELTEQGLAAAVYTQLTDVEEESNGILTYDRKVCKWEPQEAKDFCSKE